MKKMLDSKFLFILSLSILVLIGLGIGAFYLFDNSDNNFVKSGYVLNPLSSKVEKYFFDEKTSYRENLSSMIEFKDVDNNNVTILKDSFLHYNDESISFLQNGAILDLNSINGKDAVYFYNITNESMIEKEEDGYVIRTSTNDINLRNFIGRINDNKYIIAGNLELKIPGNNATTKGDYFEIVYTENGVVNIENREVKYQVTAEDTYILAGDILIDLGNKKIAKGKTDIMSITAITINGDENIEIIPKAKEETTTTKNNGGNGTGNNNEKNNNGNNDNNNGNNITENNETVVERENSLKVSLKNAEVTSTDITVKFDMENTVLTDNFSLRITDLETGKVIKKYESIEANKPYTVPYLNPSTKYLFTVVNESDNGKYIQKILETNPLGITIEKAYATENKLGYFITAASNSEVTSAKLILKKFNEETGQTETVKDDDGNDRVIELNNLNRNGEPIEKFFTNLESDSIYTAVLCDFMVPPYNLESSSNDDAGYKIAVTAMTLKKSPNFGNVSLTKDKTENKFKLAINNIVDEDKAILSYTYVIKHKDLETNTLVESVPNIVKNNASPIELSVGDGENELMRETRHYYQIIIEYFDNEKILEYVITDNDNYLEMEIDPLITIVPDDNIISYNRIGGTIYLIDNSCLLSSNPEECSLTRNAIVQIINDPSGNTEDETTIVTTKNIQFTPNEEGKLMATLDVGGLEEGTFYTIRVKANRTDMPNVGTVPIDYSNEVRGISTKSLSNFYIDWKDKESSRQNVVNVTGQFIADNVGDMTKEESAQAIKRVEVYLYDGKLSTEMIENGVKTPLTSPIVKLYTNNFDIKESFYDNPYEINNNNPFGLDFNALANKTNDKIQEYYTIYIRAYYNESGTMPIRLSESSHSYRVDDALLRDDLGDMSIVATPITEGNDGPYSNLHNADTIIGYRVTASWEVNKLLAAHFEPKKVKIYVYDENNQQVSFYLEPNGTPVSEIYEDVASYAPVNIYMDYGKESPDNIMRRGNKYYIGFELEVMSTEDSEGRISYLPVNDSGIPKNRGKFVTVQEEKEIPKFGMYLTKSTNDSVTYYYEIDDPDNALYRENSESDYGLYYSINNNETIIPITEDRDGNSNHNKFNGNITISNLTKGTYYAIYLKNGGVDNNYPEVSDNTLKLFEGKYEANDYNFEFEIINNELTDNQVKIKILANDVILSRIVNYKVTFKTTQNNQEEGQTDKTKEINVGSLVPCSASSEDNRCIIVDYYDLRKAGMKSTNTNIKKIFVTVAAMYDTGLAGYDYIVGNPTENDDPNVTKYKYMIMQGNNTKAAPGKYVTFTEGAIKPNTCTDQNDETTCQRTFNLMLWTENSTTHKGYYRYNYKSTDDKVIQYIGYYAKLISPNSKVTIDFPKYTLDMDGRKVSISNESIALNPKMLVEENMDTDNNYFSFNSYTPTIKITGESYMLNGEIVTLELSGAEPNEFCETNSTNECVNHQENGVYNLYIDVWDNLEDIGNKAKIVRPTIAIQIDNANPNKSYTQIIDGLKDTKTYYFRVYAWLNKNNIKNYTQLFDRTLSVNEFKTKDYKFTTWTVDNVSPRFNIKSILSDDENREYGDRMLETTIQLNAYTNASVKFNYDVTYVVCDKNKPASECTPNNESIILKNTILANKLATTNVNKLAINRNFEHGKEYRVYVYATYDYYDNYAENRNDEPITKEIVIGAGLRTVSALIAPTLNKIERNAIYLEGESNPYAIEITPQVEDPDEVLVDGNYYVKLLYGNTPVGEMQTMTEGVYTTVASDHPFNIEDINNKINPIRFTNLTENTAYTVVVYGMANLNNYDENIPISERIRVVETDPPITVYSTDENGVGFGNIEFSATEHSIVITLVGGSNVGNIVRVDYTIGSWGNYVPDPEPDHEFYDYDQTFTGSYLTSEYGFTSDESKNPQFIISPPGMTNSLNDSYPTIIKFYLKDVAEPIRLFGSPYYTNK